MKMHEIYKNIRIKTTGAPSVFFIYFVLFCFVLFLFFVFVFVFVFVLFCFVLTTLPDTMKRFAIIF